MSRLSPTHSISLRVAPVLLMLSVMAHTANAANPSTPTDTLREVVESLLVVVADKSQSQSEKIERMAVIVDRSVEYGAMAQRIIAQPWGDASEQDRTRFVGVFKQVLVQTYASMLDSYGGERVEFLGERIKNDKYAQVKTHILGQGRKIPVAFRMVLQDGRWLLYDYVVEGVSLVRSYNGSYKSALKHGGVANLTAQLSSELQRQG